MVLLEVQKQWRKGTLVPGLEGPQELCGCPPFLHWC